NAATDTAEASGFPPNVEPCDPGSNTPKISLFATIHEIVKTPPPSSLHKLIIFVSTFFQSQLSIFQLRTKPALISLTIFTTLFSLHTTYASCKNSSDGIFTPASP